MPTLGPTAAGAVTNNNMSDDQQFAFYIGQMTEDGTLSSITFDIGNGAGAGEIAVMLGTSAGPTTAPSALITNSGGSRNDIDARSQYVFTPSGSASLTNGQHIWLLSIRRGDFLPDIARYGAASGTNHEFRLNTPYATFVADMSGAIDDDTKPIVAAYITYTTGGGGGGTVNILGGKLSGKFGGKL